jgi:hypothetical protein
MGRKGKSVDGKGKGAKVEAKNVFNILEQDKEEEGVVMSSGDDVQLAAHFFPKFENTDTTDLWETTKEFASSSISSSVSSGEYERGLLATLKHSGHLILMIGLKLS